MMKESPVNLLVNLNSMGGPLTGIGRYTLEILNQLLASEITVALYGFGNKGCYNSTEVRQLIKKNNVPNRGTRALRFPTVPSAMIHCLKRLSAARSIQGALLNGRLNTMSLRYPDCVYWEPNYTRRKTELPSIVNIHDLCHVRHPCFIPAQRERWLRSGIEKTLTSASRIITISQFMKREIQEVYGVSANNIDIVEPGVSSIFRRRYSPFELDDVRTRYALPEHYLLFVGTMEPRKNLSGLINAYLLLSPSLRKRYPLVLVGCQGWKHEQTDRIISRLQCRSELIKLSYVDQSDLPLLYQAASALAYVSFYEGFGMPIAEAMASGIPVITSALGSMEEAALGCAQLVDPEDVHSIAEGLSTVLGGGEAVRLRCERALQMSKKYDWKASASALLSSASLARAE